MRKAAAESFAHALSLSLDYHQTKRTGSLARTIDRGARARVSLALRDDIDAAYSVLASLLGAGIAQ